MVVSPATIFGFNRQRHGFYLANIWIQLIQLSKYIKFNQFIVEMGLSQTGGFIAVDVRLTEVKYFTRF